MLATARELGIDEVYAVGGAQAIAAFAYGTETIAAGRQDRRPGQPLGDRGEAARLRRRRDRPPGRPERGARHRRRLGRPGGVRRRPARPGRARAGQRGDAGHDERRVADEVLARRTAARIELVGSLDEALERANELRARSTSSCSSPTRRRSPPGPNAGSVFVGTTAVLGDYAAGANHVLPTGGLARGAGGLGLEAFLKPVQFVRATPEGLAAVRETVEALADLEGLPLHARVGGGPHVSARPLPDGFEPYVWASTARGGRARATGCTPPR